MTLARRLLLGATVVVSVLVVAVVTLADWRLRGRLVEDAVIQLAREARLVASAWLPGADTDSLADAAGAALGHRVTLISDDGTVVGDSEFDDEALRRLENHALRPEIRDARQGMPFGWARRTSASAGDEELYVAVRAPSGTARVSIGDAGIARIESTAGAARGDVILAGLAALALAMIFASVFARQITQPIVALRDVARALAAGDLTRRAEISAPGEVGDLAGAVHQMADQLALRLRALQSEDALTHALVESLHEGVVAVDRRRTVVRINASGRHLLGVRDTPPFSADLLPRERTLRAALDDALSGQPTDTSEVRVEGRTLVLTARPLAEGGAVLALFDLTQMRRLEAIRRDFVANVSHELKTPLTVIAGFAETLADDDVAPELRRQFVESIRTSTQRMQRIVDDLLDLSRIESGGWRPDPVPVSVQTAATDAMTSVEHAAEAKGVHLNIEVPPHLQAIADPTALRQILVNLAENAVRYTPPGGNVTIFAEQAPSGTWIGVRDSGIGIAAEHLPRIFERFYRVDPGRSRDAGGTGLGLAIVKHLVEAHGGRVHAESAPGRGTTIRSFFPAAVAAAPVRVTGP